MKNLHIFGQYHQHETVHILGDVEALTALRNALDETVEIIDFAYPPSVFDDMAALMPEPDMSKNPWERGINVLDHHATAVDKLRGYHNPKVSLVLDIHRSGAKLAFDHHSDTFHVHNIPDGIEKLALLVDDRDRWVFNIPESEAVNRVLSLHHADTVEEFHTWIRTTWLRGESNQRMLQSQGETLLEADKARIQQTIRNAWEVAIYIPSEDHGGDVVRAPIVNVPVDIVSATLHTLAAASPSKMAIGFHVSHRGVHMSLRSTADGPDVAKYAESYGGGGHKHAAGFIIGHDEFEQWGPL